MQRTFYASSEGYLTLLNRLAGYTNVNVIFNVVIFLCAFLSTSFAGLSLIAIIMALISTLWMVGLYAVVLAPSESAKHDRIYAAFLLAIVSAIIVGLIAYLGGGALLSEISSFFEDIL